jgi:hypothetical protein
MCYINVFTDHPRTVRATLGIRGTRFGNHCSRRVGVMVRYLRLVHCSLDVAKRLEAGRTTRLHCR